MKFSNNLTTNEKTQLFLFREGTASLGRILVGGVLGSVVGMGITTGSMVMLGLVSGGLVGLTSASQVGIERAKRQVLTDSYRSEIAAVTGKEPQQVTTSDLEEMCKTPDEGGHGSYAIKAALKDYERVRNFQVLAQAATAGVMIMGLVALGLIFPIAPIVMAGIASLMYNEVYDAIRTGGEIMFDINKGTVTRDIRAITEQINLGGHISSTRVLGVFVKADPKLAEAIRKRYDDDYESLSINTKRELVQEMDKQYHIYQTTQDINLGHINPTELAFLAYGQHSGVPRREKALMPFNDSDYTPGKDLEIDQGKTPHSESDLVPVRTIQLEPRTQKDVFHSERLRARREKDPFHILH